MLLRPSEVSKEHVCMCVKAVIIVVVVKGDVY